MSQPARSSSTPMQNSSISSKHPGVPRAIQLLSGAKVADSVAVPRSSIAQSGPAGRQQRICCAQNPRYMNPLPVAFPEVSPVLSVPELCIFTVEVVTHGIVSTERATSNPLETPHLQVASECSIKMLS